MTDYYPVHALGIRPNAGRLTSNGEYFATNCPWCIQNGEPTSDTKQRLHICVEVGPKLGKYHCFRCGYKGRVSKTAEPDLNILKSKDSFLRSIDLDNAKNFTLKRKVKACAGVALPVDYKPLTKGYFAYEYLMSRGLTQEDIDYYQIGVGAGRVIFPDYDKDGKLEYWVGRAYDGSNPKYYNCEVDDAVSRVSLIYNLGRFLRTGSRSLTVCEGPISAIAAGKDAVATYGKGFSPEQVARLNALDLGKVYVAFDPDAKKRAIKLAENLWREGVEIFLVPIPACEDPASLGRSAFQLLKERLAIQYTPWSFSAKVRFLQAS